MMTATSNTTIGIQCGSPSRGRRQPRVSCVRAPSVVLSAPDGQIDEGGVQGWLYADRRLLSRLRITVNGSAPVGLSDEVRGAAGAVFRAVVPQVGAPTNDPTFFVERRRDVGHDSLVETVTFTSAARTPTAFELAVQAAADLSAMAEVRVGKPRTAVLPERHEGGLRWVSGDDSVVVAADPARSMHLYTALSLDPVGQFHQEDLLAGDVGDRLHRL